MAVRAAMHADQVHLALAPPCTALPYRPRPRPAMAAVPQTSMSRSTGRMRSTAGTAATAGDTMAKTTMAGDTEALAALGAMSAGMSAMTNAGTGATRGLVIRVPETSRHGGEGKRGSSNI